MTDDRITQITEQVDVDRIEDRLHHVLEGRHIYLASTARVSPAVELLVTRDLPLLLAEVRRLRGDVS